MMLLVDSWKAEKVKPIFVDSNADFRKKITEVYSDKRFHSIHVFETGMILVGYLDGHAGSLTWNKLEPPVQFHSVSELTTFESGEAFQKAAREAGHEAVELLQEDADHIIFEWIGKEK